MVRSPAASSRMPPVASAGRPPEAMGPGDPVAAGGPAGEPAEPEPAATTGAPAAETDAAAQPAAYLYWHNPVGMGSLRGHLVIMLSPERATSQTVAWWQMMFRNDTASHDMLVGANCGFCNHSSDYNYGANTLLK